MGKDISEPLEKVKNIDWRSKINVLMDKLRPWALTAGRVATRPLLQFYYVMDDDNTSTLDHVLIYAAIFYTILPMDLIPSVVYKFLGILDDGVAMLFVYKKIKDKITPEINAKVEDTLNEWFGVEYELVK
uniref:YkvA family protein n=1 Tax=Alistipes sp. TaxID=1872444 RepID=UPI004056FA9C